MEAGIPVTILLLIMHPDHLAIRGYPLGQMVSVPALQLGSLGHHHTKLTVILKVIVKQRYEYQQR